LREETVAVQIQGNSDIDSIQRFFHELGGHPYKICRYGYFIENSRVPTKTYLPDDILPALMELEQRVDTRFPFREGVEAQDIHTRLSGQFDDAVDSLRSVQRWC
jgi:hypothetical protein